MHLGKWPAALPAAKRLACVEPEVDLRECTLLLILQKYFKKWKRQNPLWLLNPEEKSPEIQNRGTSGPQKGHAFAVNFKKQTNKKNPQNM